MEIGNVLPTIVIDLLSGAKCLCQNGASNFLYEGYEPSLYNGRKHLHHFKVFSIIANIINTIRAVVQHR